MTTCRDINELTPVAQTACRLFMKKCGEAGLHIFVTETYRSQARQNQLYAQGRTEPGKVVTWTLNSRHTSRRAWDIAVIGKDLYDMTVIRQAGAIGQSLGITWGGIWSPPDYCHFEITEDWTAPEEVEEVKEVRYNTIDEIPDWGRETIQGLIDDGCFADPNHLDLSKDMVRVFVILGRRK